MYGLQSKVGLGGIDGCCVCTCVILCEIGMEGVVMFAFVGRDWSRDEMLAPALLTGPAVPIVTIGAVFWCARGHGFLCVGAEELCGEVIEVSY